ncbi:SDR family NAD(P)-dependent oxidoreductase [Mesorhizobium sp. M1409]|uniref:SDR family NAD(P)-dependent oxidoreductase n=1 Tax=unclassified Mesorhizobium TaxID=325217 RepID=UPI003336F2F5
MKLTDNTILITAGASGIGRGLAEAFHELGNEVVIAGRRRALLEEVAAANPGIQTMQLDVGNSHGIRAVTEQLILQFPSQNVLINNAEIMPFDDAGSEIDEKMTEKVIMTNLLGPIRLTSALIEHLKKQARATIINNTSILGFVPLANAADPAFLYAFTTLHAAEHVGRRAGNRSPFGFFKTTGPPSMLMRKSL